MSISALPPERLPMQQLRCCDSRGHMSAVPEVDPSGREGPVSRRREGLLANFLNAKLSGNRARVFLNVRRIRGALT